jgi:hypothetical protein
VSDIRKRPTGDVKELIIQCQDISVSLSFWRGMASYPVEEGGTIKVVDCNTRYNAFLNMFSMNINSALDIEVSVTNIKNLIRHLASEGFFDSTLTAAIS